MKSESNVSILCPAYIYTPGIRTNYLSITLLRLDSPYAINYERPSSSTYVLFLSDAHIFLLFVFFLHQDHTHTHSRTFIHLSTRKRPRNKESEQKEILYLDDNDDDLYVLHLTATGEVQQWNAFVDVDNRWDRSAREERMWEGGEKRREEKREREWRICKRTWHLFNQITTAFWHHSIRIYEKINRCKRQKK